MHACRFTSGNAEEILRDYDLIVDGTDNFATRYLSNDVAVFAGKPNVYGSIFRFDGQTTVFAPHLGGPCYRCLFPEPPHRAKCRAARKPACSACCPGSWGRCRRRRRSSSFSGLASSFVGRLLHFDALKMKFREFNLRRDPDCPVCGEQPTITAPIDYEMFCQGAPDLTAAVPQIQVRELEERMASGRPWILLDVREPFEFEMARIEGANLIPLGELPARGGSWIGRRRFLSFVTAGCGASGRRSFCVRRDLPEWRMWRAESTPGRRRSIPVFRAISFSSLLMLLLLLRIPLP